MTNDEPTAVMEEEPWATARQEGTSVVREDAPGSPVYDLEERTALFGETVIDFLKKVPRGPHTDRPISQLTGCSTSVGANYCEADDAVSKKEFVVNANRCRKEARESEHFLHQPGSNQPGRLGYELR